MYFWSIFTDSVPTPGGCHFVWNGSFVLFCFCLKAEHINFHFLQNLLAYPYFRPSYISLNIFFKKSPKNGHFGKYAPSLTKCHFFVFDFFVLKLERQLKINVNFHSVKKIRQTDHFWPSYGNLYLETRIGGGVSATASNVNVFCN